MILKRLVCKMFGMLSGFCDPYSISFRFLSARLRIKVLSFFTKVGSGTAIKGRIIVPSPQRLEIGESVSIKSLSVAAENYLLIERGVRAGDLHFHNHAIVTKTKTYAGHDIPERVVTLSVDFEGGVALSHAPKESWQTLRSFWDSGEAVLRLSQLFKAYRIPVTWAICGHLFLKECNGNHDIFEKDWYGDWFKHDPGNNYRQAPGWYMPEIIELLRNEPLFDIGYHSFGHYFYQRCSEDTVNKDISMAEQIRSEWSLELASFVFPYNQCAQFDLLVTKGHFRNFRGNIGSIYPAYGIFDFGDFRYFNTTQMFSPDAMDRCISQLNSLPGKTANYYTHCYQWIERDGWGALEEWLQNISEMRDTGRIQIRTMGEV